jgi:cytochrome d ubiquinol oxidase subunit I
MPYRVAHTLLASGLTVAFLVAGISAYRWLKHDRSPALFAALRTSIGFAALLVPLQSFVGDLHGLNTLEHQPQKVAAIEANWETRSAAPLVLFAIPNEATSSNDFEIALPFGASLILTHDLYGVVPGLNDFVGAHPPVAPVFFAFRVMVGIGLAMLVVSWSMAWLLWRRRDLTPWSARILVGMTFAGWAATLAGWYVTEIGRQPWLVSGVLRTAEAASAVPAPMIGLTLSLYLIVYALLLTTYVTVVLRLARKAAEGSVPSAVGPARPGRPAMVAAE